MNPAGTLLLPGSASRLEEDVPALVSALAEAYETVKAAADAYARHVASLRRVRRGINRIAVLMDAERSAYRRRRLSLRTTVEPQDAEARQAWERWKRAHEALRRAQQDYRERRDYVAGLVRFLTIPFLTAVDLTAAASGIPRPIVMRMFTDPRGVRLLPTERQEIVARLQAGETASSLADEFGVGVRIVRLLTARARYVGHRDETRHHAPPQEAPSPSGSSESLLSGWPDEVVSRLRALGEAWAALRRASMDEAVARYASRQVHRAAALGACRLHIARSSHIVMMGYLATAQRRLTERAKSLERALPDAAAHLQRAVRSYEESRARLAKAIGAMGPDEREAALAALQSAMGVTREVAQWLGGMVKRYRRTPDGQVDEIRRMLRLGYPHAAVAVLAHVSERVSKLAASAL